MIYYTYVCTLWIKKPQRLQTRLVNFIVDDCSETCQPVNTIPDDINGGIQFEGMEVFDQFLQRILQISLQSVFTYRRNRLVLFIFVDRVDIRIDTNRDEQSLFSM